MNALDVKHREIPDLGTSWLHASPGFPGGNGHALAEHCGRYELKSVRGTNIRISEITAEKDCSLQVTDENLPDVVHIFIPLSGTVSARYPGCALRTEMLPDHHHHVYAPVTEYEWKLSGRVHLVDVAIRTDYLIGLLADTDPWTSTLRAKLSHRQPVAGRPRAVCMQMYGIIRDIFASNLPCHLKHIYVKGKALELVALQLQHAMADPPVDDSDPAPGPLGKKDREVLAEVHAYLTRCFKEEHSLSGLSKTYGLNEFALKRGFKMVYGKTVFEYLFEVRMDYARRMLDEGSMVREVSREIGYRNPNHFSTAFKKKFGINPLFFRKHRQFPAAHPSVRKSEETEAIGFFS